MAKTKKDPEIIVSLISNNPAIKRPRLTKLIVKNFRCIGTNPVSIDLNDIVVLVGANNVGKSCILKAYEVAMSEGSKDGELKLEDFPNGRIDQNILPEIELHTIVYENTPGDRWITKLESGELLIKERWIWEKEGSPKRQGWDTIEKAWSEQRPWGAPNVANSGRPEPHRVDAFDPPEKQTSAIKTILMNAVNDRVKNLKSANKEEENEYHQLLSKVKDLQKKIVLDTQEKIDEVNKELSELIDKIFPAYKIDFDAKPEENLDKTINLFKADPQLLMGPQGGYLSTVERQGSGARRTLLWTALKYISESNQKVKGLENGRPHLLLIDEPEICLHPNAIRDACNVLYDLPNSSNWQVMVTTHSPIFIDFSRDNTTIIRVERNATGSIEGTTVYRPDKVNLDTDDKKNLKLLNICDPYVAEFFFGGKIIVVEGDTEYTAFNYVKESNPDIYKNIHIIRARGKATIVSLIKILNHFGSSYSILHDSDKPLTKKGASNPAWGNNSIIFDEVGKKPIGTKTRLLASLPNFEQAYFGDIISSEKPYNAIRTIFSDSTKFKKIEKLFQALIDHSAPLPDNCAEWSSIKDLEEKLESVLTT